MQPWRVSYLPLFFLSSVLAHMIDMIKMPWGQEVNSEHAPLHLSFLRHWALLHCETGPRHDSY